MPPAAITGYSPDEIEMILLHELAHRVQFESVPWLRPLLRELLDWLGEPWSDRVLQHHSVQTGRGGRLTVEGKNRIDDPIDVSRIDKWFRTLPEGRRPALHRKPCHALPHRNGADHCEHWLRHALASH
jgi:hypothetical protein